MEEEITPVEEKVVVTVDNTTGRIITMGVYMTDQVEGEDPEGNYYTVFYYGVPPVDFAELYYYDIPNGEFLKGPPMPHPHVYWDLATASWIPNEDRYMEEVIQNRTRLLYLTDWCFVSDVSLGSADTQLVTAYRQELRDFPATITDFSIPVEDQDWPEVPPFLIQSSSTRAVFMM